MHVVLVGAEFEENLAVRYLWGALEAAGHRVQLIVFNRRSDLLRAARELADSGAPLAGLSMVFTARAREFVELAAEARALGYRGHIVAGGHFAGLHPEQLLSDVPAIDSVALGEGEELLCELARHLDSLGEVAGLVWRKGSELVRNGAAVKPPDLDRLARPPRKVPLDTYLGLGVTNILSSRGCSHACAFCSIAAWHAVCGGARVRMRDVDEVVDEMAQLHRRGARIFNFHDDNFLPATREARWARVEAFGQALERRRLGRIAFAIKARPDALDEDLCVRLQQLGMFRLFLGIEAGTTESLAELGRRQSVEDNVRALELANRLGIHCCFNLLVLNPASSLEDLAANVAFLRAHPRNPMNFCRTEIYAGTPLEKRLRAQGRLRGDYWGRDYRIADERAQAAFEVIFPCFATRNFSEEGLHHLTMQVDYEHQLRAHFFGTSDELACRVKRFVIQVNLNTVAHLEALLGALRGELPDAARRAELVGRHQALIEEDGQRLRAQGLELLAEIRAAVVAPTARRRWARAAVAGVAASMVVAAACKQQVPTEPTEMAPAPPADGGPTNWTPAVEMVALPPPDEPPDAGTVLQIEPADAGDSTHMAEMVARPPLPVSPDAAGFYPEALFPQSLRRQAISVLLRYVKPQDVELELGFDFGGAVNHIALRGSKLDRQVVRQAGPELGALRTADPDTVGRRFKLHLTAAELGGPLPVPTHVAEMAPPPPPTQPREMAPRPPPRPPTQPREMAPQPFSVTPGGEPPGDEGSDPTKGSRGL